MNRFSRSIQENLLVILCFDEENCKRARNFVEPHYFDPYYKEIAIQAINHIDKYDKPPKEHIVDLLEKELEQDKNQILVGIIANIFDIKDKVDPKFTLDKAGDFVSLQNLKTGILKAAAALENNDEDAAEKARDIILSHVTKSTKTFNIGTVLSSGSALSFLFDEDDDILPTGIPELDNQGIGPIRGGLYVFMAVYGAGKTFHLIHLGKMAMLSGLKVCQISLEMSEKRISSRWHQSLFSIPKRNLESEVSRFKKSDEGKYEELEREILKFNVSMQEKEKLLKYLKKERELHKRFLKNVVIKQFPTGTLTINELNAYLDYLEIKGFVPDVLIIDYADIMHVDQNNYRIALGKLYENLRGIAVSRNIAVITASQANREALSRKKVTGKNVAEDFKKLATADFVITYSQTDIERKLKLARLYVDKARDEAGHQTILISQDYERGQFVVDSCIIDDNYWEDLGISEE